jgi:DNA-directed RNA polymerase specialized sigma24 family protein
MYEFGYSNAEIADIMEIKEAEVRDLLKKEEKAA